MVQLKSKEEIEIMTEGGKRLNEVVNQLLPTIKEGISTLAIDQEAERLIRKLGGTPSFQTVKGYRWSTCLPINEQAVHTPPMERTLKSGDILTIDIGFLYKGYHTDYAISLIIGEPTEEKMRFLEVGKRAVEKGINQAKLGNHLGNISQVIENEVTKNGYFILKDLTGHGIGRELHEDPYVFNYLDRPVNKTMKINEGLVVAIEVIYSMGTEEIAYEKEGEWSIRTRDRSLSACFEHTVAITAKNTHILV